MDLGTIASPLVAPSLRPVPRSVRESSTSPEAVPSQAAGNAGPALGGPEERSTPAYPEASTNGGQ